MPERARIGIALAAMDAPAIMISRIASLPS